MTSTNNKVDTDSAEAPVKGVGCGALVRPRISPMKKPIRDAIADLGMSVCRMADSATAQAKEYALDALDGDAKAQSKALEYRAEAKAYMRAVKAVDDLRVAIERGDFA